MKSLLITLFIVAANGVAGGLEYSFDEEVKSYMDKCNLAHSEIVLAQAKLESNNFKSELFLRTNNMFGMKVPYKRPTTAIGEDDHGYAIYQSWQHSVIDYYLYQQWNYKGGDYFRFLETSKYAEDVNYVQAIKRRMNE